MMHIFEQVLTNHIFEYDVVLVGMGINNSFSRGFANEIAVNFPFVREEENRNSPYGDRNKYGTVFECRCDGVIFCMCYMHNGGYRKNKEYVSYEHLRKCLEHVAEKYKGKRIASPIIGSSKYDGNGDKDKILGIYSRVFQDCNIDVYDFVPEAVRDTTYREMILLKRKKKNGEIGVDEYNRAMNKLYWIRENGIFKQMPGDYRRKKKTFSWDDVITVKKTDLDK